MAIILLNIQQWATMYGKIILISQGMASHNDAYLSHYNAVAPRDEIQVEYVYDSVK